MGNNQDVRLRVTATSDNGHQISTVYHFFDTVYLIGNSTNFNAELYYSRVPPSGVVKISSIPTAAGAANRLDANVHLLIQHN